MAEKIVVEFVVKDKGSVVISKATKQMDKFGKESAQASKTISSSFKKITTAALGIGAALATAFAARRIVSGISNLINQTAAAADHFDKLSKRLGITTEALSQLEFAAKLSGVQTNALDMALQRMTRRVAEASQGLGEAQGALKDLGLDAGRLAAMSPDKMFLEIAQAVSQIGDQNERVRLLFKIFDSEGVVVGQMMERGAEGIREMMRELDALGATADRSLTVMAARFQDAKTRIGFAFVGLRNEIARNLLPVATVFVNKFIEEIKRLRTEGKIQEWAKDAANAVLDAFEIMIRGAELFLSTVNLIKVAFDRLKQTATAVIGNITEDKLAQANKMLEININRLERLERGDFMGLFATEGFREKEIERTRERIKELQQEVLYYNEKLKLITKSFMDQEDSLKNNKERVGEILGALDDLKYKFQAARKESATLGDEIEKAAKKLEFQELDKSVERVASSIKKRFLEGLEEDISLLELEIREVTILERKYKELGGAITAFVKRTPKETVEQFKAMGKEINSMIIDIADVKNGIELTRKEGEKIVDINRAWVSAFTEAAGKSEEMNKATKETLGYGMLYLKYLNDRLNKEKELLQKSIEIRREKGEMTKAEGETLIRIFELQRQAIIERATLEKISANIRQRQIEAEKAAFVGKLNEELRLRNDIYALQLKEEVLTGKLTAWQAQELDDLEKRRANLEARLAHMDISEEYHRARLELAEINGNLNKQYEIEKLLLELEKTRNNIMASYLDKESARYGVLQKQNEVLDAQIEKLLIQKKLAELDIAKGVAGTIREAAEGFGTYEEQLTAQMQLLEADKLRNEIQLETLDRQSAQAKALMLQNELLDMQIEKLRQQRDLDIGGLLQQGMRAYALAAEQEMRERLMNFIPSVFQNLSNSFYQFAENVILGQEKLADGWKNFLKSMHDWWIKLLLDMLKAFFNNFLQQIIQGLAGVQGQMGGMFGGGMGGGGGILGGIFSIVGSLFGGGGGLAGAGSMVAFGGGAGGFTGFQEGGIVTRPTLGLVGEAGPEAIIPLPRKDEFMREEKKKEIKQNIYLVDERAQTPSLGPNDVIYIVAQDIRNNGIVRNTLKERL